MANDLYFQKTRTDNTVLHIIAIVKCDPIGWLSELTLIHNDIRLGIVELAKLLNQQPMQVL